MLKLIYTCEKIRSEKSNSGISTTYLFHRPNTPNIKHEQETPTTFQVVDRSVELKHSYHYSNFLSTLFLTNPETTFEIGSKIEVSIQIVE